MVVFSIAFLNLSDIETTQLLLFLQTLCLSRSYSRANCRELFNQNCFDTHLLYHKQNIELRIQFSKAIHTGEQSIYRRNVNKYPLLA